MTGATSRNLRWLFMCCFTIPAKSTVILPRLDLCRAKQKQQRPKSLQNVSRRVPLLIQLVAGHDFLRPLLILCHWWLAVRSPRLNQQLRRGDRSHLTESSMAFHVLLCNTSQKHCHPTKIRLMPRQTKTAPKITPECCSPHLCVGFLFWLCTPVRSSSRLLRPTLSYCGGESM